MVLAGVLTSGRERAHRGAADGRSNATVGQARARRVALQLVTALLVTAACAALASSADATIYWDNVSSDTIAEANNNGTAVNQSFIKGADGPADLVAAGGYLYWSNVSGCTEYGSCPGSIARANLNGTGVNESFIPATTPYGLTVAGNYIYWGNAGSNSIGRATLAGTEVDQDFITGAHEPNGVVVNGQTIYWANTGSNSIGRATLAGTEANQDFITGASVPEGMAINSQYIYWANHNDRTIGRAALAGTELNQNFITNVGAWPTRVTVTSQDIYWTTWTGGNEVPSPGEIGEATLGGTVINEHLITSEATPVGVWVTEESAPSGGSSSGHAAKCSVPNVRHKKLAAAEKALSKAHCAVGKIKRARSRHVNRGAVISQGPAAGKPLPAGSKVNLVVSKG